MPTIVADRISGQRYVLVGTGYAATETATPGMILGNLSPDIETKTYGVVALCDEAGNIRWGWSKEFVVVEVDGLPPARLIAGPPYR
jgi:hypothetical protein